MDGAAGGLDHRPAVGLLVIGDADHEDLALEVEELAGKGERRAPLARLPSPSRACRSPGLAVVVGLSNGGIRLVGAGGGDALVLVVDVRRGIELALQAPGAVGAGWGATASSVSRTSIRDLDQAARSRPPARSAPSGRSAPGLRGLAAPFVPGWSGGTHGSPGRSAITFHPAGRDLLFGEQELHFLWHPADCMLTARELITSPLRCTGAR